MCVVIPSFNETELQASLESLNNCILPNCDVEIIVLINEPQNASVMVSAQNRKSYDKAIVWSQGVNRPGLTFHVLCVKDIPEKKHGVGFARKIGMDEACRRLHFNQNLKAGIIVAFDADSTCSSNYLVEIEQHFAQFRSCPGVSIYFEHQIHEIEDSHIREGIVQYELHLRYLIQAHRFAGFHNAFYTVGSSMAIRADAYIKAGGMNTRKAGEDFYFLHRIITMGNFMELNTPVIYPSSRESDRVPFGTGRAMLHWSGKNLQLRLTSNPETFIALKTFLSKSIRSLTFEEIMQDLHECIKTFLIQDQFEGKWEKIVTETKTKESFRKRFFGYFDAFKILKFMHHCREYYFDDIPVTDAAQ